LAGFELNQGPILFRVTDVMICCVFFYFSTPNKDNQPGLIKQTK